MKEEESNEWNARIDEYNSISSIGGIFTSFGDAPVASKRRCVK